MKKEFNLSEHIKRRHPDAPVGFCWNADIKEFIRLRDGLDRLLMLKQITRQEHADKCDKLAGKDLI